MKKVIVVFILLALILFSSGCATATNIGEITANPSPYEGKEVTIEGTASSNFWLALLNKGAYKLTDDTGSI